MMEQYMHFMRMMMGHPVACAVVSATAFILLAFILYSEVRRNYEDY